MSDIGAILSLWAELDQSQLEYVLATIVAVDGPSYRKPGAMMLLAKDGRRAGTISGGCLEAEVAKRAFWHTETGPTICQYSTADDDGERPFGSGCGGTVHILLERDSSAKLLLDALDHAYEKRTAIAVATILDWPRIGARVIARVTEDVSTIDSQNETEHTLLAFATNALAERASRREELQIDGQPTQVWADFRLERPGISIFGAGDDALPLVALARQLGWYVSIADGRAHLATHERFPLADQVRVLPIAELPGPKPESSLHFLNALESHDAAIVMTHSFEQDAKILACLLSSAQPVAYIGLLGPKRRSREVLEEAARLLEIPSDLVSAQIETWLNQIHAPTGLDLGADSPATVALSIVSEVQKVRSRTSARPLSEVRS